MTDKIVVFTACGSAEEAEKIARGLVERRLAACVNIVPGMRSIYHWKGAVEDAAEWLVLIKSSRDKFEGVRAAIEELHSYEVPEVVAVPVDAISEKYGGWMDAELHREEH